MFFFCSRRLVRGSSIQWRCLRFEFRPVQTLKSNGADRFCILSLDNARCRRDFRPWFDNQIMLRSDQELNPTLGTSGVCTYKIFWSCHHFEIIILFAVFISEKTLNIITWYGVKIWFRILTRLVQSVLHRKTWFFESEYLRFKAFRKWFCVPV